MNFLSIEDIIGGIIIVFNFGVIGGKFGMFIFNVFEVVIVVIGCMY